MANEKVMGFSEDEIIKRLNENYYASYMAGNQTESLLRSNFYLNLLIYKQLKRLEDTISNNSNKNG